MPACVEAVGRIRRLAWWVVFGQPASRGAGLQNPVRSSSRSLCTQRAFKQECTQRSDSQSKIITFHQIAEMSCVAGDEYLSADPALYDSRAIGHRLVTDSGG